MWIEEACREYGFNTEQAERLWAEWRQEVNDGKTSLGYMYWLKEKITEAAGSLPYVVDGAITHLEGYGCTPENDALTAKMVRIINLVAPAMAAERERIRKGRTS